jgi:hypothetical protein
MTIVMAFFVYAPSWGLMDDLGSLQQAKLILASGDIVGEIARKIVTDATGWGIFRPVYWVWLTVVYGLLGHSAVASYLMVSAWMFCAMGLWGVLYFRYFDVDDQAAVSAKFFFPLLFFVFTPFWNVFMYLSLQEKFILFFSPLALIAFRDVYFSARWKQALLAAIGWALLATFSKPTGIYLLMIFTAFAVLDIVLWRIDRMKSAIVLLTAGCSFAAYAVFSFAVQLKGAYTGRYAQNLTVSGLCGSVAAMPLILKALVCFAVVSAVYWTVHAFVQRNKQTAFGVLLPLGLLAYVGILLPWGFLSYLLCALSPLLCGMAYPLYRWFCKKGVGLRIATDAVLAAFVFAAVIGVVVPRISDMADVRLVQEYMRSAAEHTGKGTYFMTSYPESAGSLEGFTGETVKYLEGSELTPQMLTDARPNYVILNQLCAAVSLNGVRIVSVVYRNRTWAVARVESGQNAQTVFAPEFQRSVLQKLAARVKKL